MSKKRITFHDDDIVEVVMRKKIKYKDYKSLVRPAENKGWRINAYELDFYNDGFSIEID